MREAGRVTAQAMQVVQRAIAPGISTQELDKLAETFIISKGAVPSFKGYNGFPASACISINEQVVHGIPGNTILREGDIVSVDLGAILDGYHGDMARTFAVGQISAQAQRLIDVTRECFEVATRAAIPGNRIGDIGYAVQSLAEGQGYGVVRDLCGHGIGTQMHEDPEIPNYGRAGRGIRLEAGMVLAIEPMINIGTWKVRALPDGWTICTADGSLSAHHENTVAVTHGESLLLTAL